MSNVLSWNQALEQGLNPRDYSYRKEDVPLGEYIASLDFKIWAKDATGVSCYFTKVDTDQKILLTVYRTHDTREYILDGVDFKECPTGKYLITVELNSKGNIKFSKVKPA